MKKAILIFAIAISSLAAAQTTPSYLPTRGGNLTGPVDNTLYKPSRTGTFPTDQIVGSFNGYRWNGAIPGTSSFNFGQLNHIYMDHGVLDTTPGCWGFQGSCFDSQHGLDNDSMTVNGGGGTNAYTFNGSFYSVGDHIGRESHITTFGGSVDGGGPEGTKGATDFVFEADNTWTGAVATGHGGAGQTTLIATCATDCGTSPYGVANVVPGGSTGSPASVGQGMIVTDEQTTVASGQIESTTNGSGEVPGTMTVNITGGVSNLSVSTCEATLTTNLNPTTDPSGSGTQTLTFNVTDVTGVCTAGGLMSFAGTNHEQAVIASVTAPSGGQQTITANLRMFHESGSYLFENANSDAGLQADIVANDSGTLKFPVEIVGVQSVSGSTAVMWWRRWFSGQQPSFVAFPAGHMVAGTFGATALSNTAGLVTMTVDVSGDTILNSRAAIFISSAVNASFDGPCTTARVTAQTFNSNIVTVTCTQAASTGLTSTNASVSLTDATLDNPFGNTRVNFYQGAAIVDPQDESNPIVINGVTNFAVSGLNFIVEPNEMTLAAGDALVEHHSEAQFHIYEGFNGVVNPVCYVCSGLDMHMSGVFSNTSGAIQNDFMYGANNTTSNAAYAYFGGAMTPTPMLLTQGMWGDMIYAKQAPYIGSAFLNSPNCPSSAGGCTDPVYNYLLYFFQGNGGINSATFFPNTNTMRWSGNHTWNGLTTFTAGSFTNPIFDFLAQGHTFATSLGGLNFSALTPVIPVWDGTPTAGDVVQVGTCNSGECGQSDAGFAANTVCQSNGTHCPTGSSPWTENVVTFSTTPTLSATASENIITLTGNVTSSTWAAGIAGQQADVVVCQNATGNFTFVWPSNSTGGMVVGTTASGCSAQSFVYSPTRAKWTATSMGVINE